MKSIVIAGTRGIGRAISKELQPISDEHVVTGQKDLDTADIEAVKHFIQRHESTDVLVLNSGGPPAKPFWDICETEWVHYFNQLFLSFALILRGIKINPGGAVFLISSYYVKEPNQNLILSNSIRIGFSSVFKSVSKLYLDKGVSFVNIAPGPTDTDRLRKLIDSSGQTMDEFVKALPTHRLGDAGEIGKFVRFIVENKIKGINGVTINFDSGLSNYVL